MKKVDIEIPEIKLGWKQKLILEVLQDEFGGSAFGPELLDNAENEDIHKLTINEITWHMLRLREDGLVSSEKLSYKGRILNKYTITPFLFYGGVKIK